MRPDSFLKHSLYLARPNSLQTSHPSPKNLACFAPRRKFWPGITVALLLFLSHSLTSIRLLADEPGELRAGAYAIDITPAAYPVIVNGGFMPVVSNEAHDPLHARCFVFSQGKTSVAFIIVDTCLFPRELADLVKERIFMRTQIPTENILISATHTHTAPSLMQVLGTDADSNYIQYVTPLLVEGVVKAQANLEPAVVGATSYEDWEHTFCRRWIRKPDRIGTDPFGEATMRANMHPGYQSPDAIGPSGPVDPGISILSIRSTSGRPIGLIANYSMHYFGSPALSADYYGDFAAIIQDHLDPEPTDQPRSSPKFVAAMSQGTSGDLMWMDYGKPQKNLSRRDYAQAIADGVLTAIENIEYREKVVLKVKTQSIKLKTRFPSSERLAWAKETVKQFDYANGGKPQNLPQIYARDQLWLDEHRERDVLLQVFQIGDYGIAAMPCEVFGLTGLKLKMVSPFRVHANFELANGEEGYIPPPEQHDLGGYTTWPTRSAMLERLAEPKIVGTLANMMVDVSGEKLHAIPKVGGAYVDSIVESKPLSFWRLGEISGDHVLNSDARLQPGKLHGGRAFFLDGPQGNPFGGVYGRNRAIHLASGCIQTSLAEELQNYSVDFWFWNGLDPESRDVTGLLLSCASEGEEEPQAVLSISGTSAETSGVLAWQQGVTEPVAFGKTRLRPFAWHHVAVVRKNGETVVYLNGDPTAELTVSKTGDAAKVKLFTFGAMSSKNFQHSFEGKLDEIAIYDRALEAEEVVNHFAASNMTPPTPLPAPQAPSKVVEKVLDPSALESIAQVMRESEPIVYLPLQKSVDPSISIGAERFRTDSDKDLASLESPNKFSGERIHGELKELRDQYSVEFWFRNDRTNDSQLVTAYLLSRGIPNDEQAAGEHIGIGGTYGWTGKLIFFNGNKSNVVLAGQTLIPDRTWNHVVYVRDKQSVRVYLNGKRDPEIIGEAPFSIDPLAERNWFIGGRSDRFANLAGEIDQVAFYDRVLTAEEIVSHFALHPLQEGNPNEAPSTKGSSQQNPIPDPGPLSPEASAKRVKLRDGFELELVAAEPLLEDPVAIDWDASGRMWVAEMIDYPSGLDGKGKPGGRIRILEDENGDGVYDKSTIFMEEINFPTGIMTWRNGCLITAAPEIFYAEDTNGDGKADLKKTLLSGFMEGNQQLRVNGLQWGLDNWVYCASGSHHAGYGAETGITIELSKFKRAVGSRDIRFLPDSGGMFPESGPSQFGRNRDDWGNWFGEQNSFPLWHYVLSDRYFSTSEAYAPPDPRRVLTSANPKVYPAKAPQKRYHSFEQSGRFTSACSGMVYRDELLFAREEIQHAFTCEPFHSLVQHNLLKPDGVSFELARDPSEGEVDFFASTDDWCRPVMVRTGPDGALWIVDMYRYMIEHPDWLTEEGKNELRPYYRAGEGMGRIYRIFPKGSRPGAIPNLQKMSSAELVSQLESPNGWVRDKVQQLLLQRDDKTIRDLLLKVARESKNPLARLHALCTLDGRDEFDWPTLAAFIRDPHPIVRREVIRICETGKTKMGTIIEALTPLADDPDPRVRLQLACSLGTIQDSANLEPMTKLLLNSGDNAYLKAAVFASQSKFTVERFVEHCLTAKVHSDDLKVLLTIYRRLHDAERLNRTLEKIASDQTLSASERARLVTIFVETLGDEADVSIKAVAEEFARAERLVAVADADLQERVAAVGILARSKPISEKHWELLSMLLEPSNPPELHQAVISRLGSIADDHAAQILISDWGKSSPMARSAIAAQLLSRESWTLFLLTQVESGTIPMSEIDATWKQRCLTHANADIATKSKNIFGSTSSESRKNILAKYAASLEAPGDITRGAKVFEAKCSACHKLDSIGTEIGPNLLALSDKKKSTLLAAILDPSQAVEAKYLSYVVETGDGRSVAGIIVSESGNSLTLVPPDGKKVQILRSEIVDVKSSGKSLMPEGLESEISVEQMADLLSYLETKMTPEK